jgi:hypothetical protein
VIRQNFRRHRAGNRAANYRHEMMPRIRHISATPLQGDFTTQIVQSVPNLREARSTTRRTA